MSQIKEVKKFGWNEKQELAIKTIDKNILVSAAAGSGKTAVLVERIKQLIINNKIPVTNFFVATFTEAAASEMKEKIKKAIKSAIKTNNYDNDFLKIQLFNLNRAQIGTFHGFCANVIRRNFQKIDVEPNFRVCDEVKAQLMKNQAMEDLVDELFEEGSGEFYDFLNAFCDGKDEENFKKIIFENYTKIMDWPNPFETLHYHVENLGLTRKDFYESKLYNYVLQTTFNDLKKAHYLAVKRQENFADKSLHDFAEKIEEEVHDIECILLNMGYDICNDKYLPIKENPNYDYLRDAINGIKVWSKRGKVAQEYKYDYEEALPMEKNLREKEKQCLDDISYNFFGKSEKEQIENINITKPRGLFFEKAIKRYHEIYSQAKRKENLIDFNDMEQFALKALDFPEVADEYKGKFKYLFVDEYQDTNFIQEAIIEKIKSENNLFVVGDVKQSIYGFRGAVPEIFENRYVAYKDEKDTNSVVIDLNTNYRSKINVINTVNDVFDHLIPNYDENAKLNPGDKYKGSCNYESELDIINDSKIFSNEESDDFLFELKKTEKEAIVIARTIRNLLGQKIWDSKKNIEREIKYKDIVLLLRTIKGKADVYYKHLMQNSAGQIPAFIDDNENYFDTIEINNFLSLLTIIDNKKQDIPLLTVLKSEIFGFTIDEMIQIRVENKGMKYYEAFINYSQNGKDENLRKKCFDALTRISEWKELSKMIPLNDFIWDLLIKTNFYLAMGALPGGMQRQINLRSLVDKAREYLKFQSPSLHGFINYIEIVKKNKVLIGQVKLVGENDDVVKIMSIHKSKGLEFPVVIVGGLGFGTKSDEYTSIIVDNQLGIGINVIDTVHKTVDKNLIYNSIINKRAENNEKERIRVYYVALTRAKDKLILVGLTNKFDNLDEVDFLKDKTPVMSNYIYQIFKQQNKKGKNNYNINMVDNDDILQYERHETEIGKQKKEAGQKNIPKPIDMNLALENLSYSYPHKKRLETKAKYSVSELNQARDSKENEAKYPPKKLKKPTFHSNEKKFSNTEMGSNYHRLMEEIDFSKMDVEINQQQKIINDTLDYMINNNIFTNEEKESIDIDKALGFFNTSIGKRAIEAAKNGKLFKEREFVLSETISVDEENGTEDVDVLIQGIIDCFFEEDGKYVLIDYKTNYIDTEKDFEDEAQRLIDEYHKQIEIYAKAINESQNKVVKEAYLYLQGVGKFIPIEI